MSPALTTLGAKIDKLSLAIRDSARASTFNMRPAIDAVLTAALDVQRATHDAVADLDQRTAALEARDHDQP